MKKAVPALLAAAIALGTVHPVQAGSKGRRNVMYGAAAVTGYGLLKHKRGLALAGAVGTGIAYHNYRVARQRENRQKRAREARLYRRRHRHHRTY